MTPAQQQMNHQARIYRMHIAREIAEVIILVAVIVVSVRLSIDTRTITEESMMPSLHNSDIVMVNKLAYLFGSPQRGDVIIFYYPFNTSVVFIKRIIGVPGDTLVVTPNSVSINGIKLNEPYVSSETSYQVGTWVLGANQYFVMGDNRGPSCDSRMWGVLDKKFIIGKVVIMYWPLNHAHFINEYHQVFSSIPSHAPPAKTVEPPTITCPGL